MIIESNNTPQGQEAPLGLHLVSVEDIKLAVTERGPEVRIDWREVQSHTPGRRFQTKHSVETPFGIYRVLRILGRLYPHVDMEFRGYRELGELLEYVLNMVQDFMFYEIEVGDSLGRQMLDVVRSPFDASL